MIHAAVPGSSSTTRPVYEVCFPVQIVAMHGFPVVRKRCRQEPAASEAMSEAIVPVEEAVSEDATAVSEATPQRIRIGPAKHNYVYEKVSDDLYKCCRGSDNCPQGHKLWLRRSSHGQWAACTALMMAPRMAADPFSPAQRMCWQAVGIRGALKCGMGVSRFS